MSRTPTKVRARRERISDYFIPLNEPPERDTENSALYYTPSRRNVHIPSKNLIYENRNVAIFDKRKHSGSNLNVQSGTDFSEEEQKRLLQLGESFNSAQKQKQTRYLTDFLYSLWQDQRMCDVVLKVDDREFPAHKIALAAHSEKFTTRYCEQEPETVSEIILPNTSKETAEHILKFIYTSELDITPRNLESILVCSRQLGITSAEQLCLDYISDFNKENVFYLMPIAERQGIGDILSKMNLFVSGHFSELSKSPSFLHGYAEHVRWFLSADTIVVPSELDIFYAALSWIDYNRQERLRFAMDLMACVRFVYIEPEDLVTYVETVRYIFDISECNDMLYEAFRYHSLRLSGSPIIHSISIPKMRRYSNYKNTMDVQLNNRDNMEETNRGHEHRLQPSVQEIPSTHESKTHEKTPDQPSSYKKRKPFPGSVAVYGTPEISMKHPPPLPGPPRPQTFIAIGGVNPFTTDNDQSCRLVEEYNERTNSWHLLTSLPVARHHLGATFLDGYLFVVGGSILTKKDPTNLANPTDICFRYDPRENYWSRIASLKIPRMYHSASVLEGVLYAAGGQDYSGRPLDSIEFYNPDTDTWGFTTPMSESKIGLASIGYKGLLFMMGGFTERGNTKVVLDTVECYDPRTNSWKTRNPLPTPCCHSNVVEVGGKLFLIGGSRGDSTGTDVVSLSSVFRYDDRDDSWELFSNMNTPRHDAGAAVLGSKIYITGGVSSFEGCTLADMECLDVSTISWSRDLDPLSHPAMGVTCCSVPMDFDYGRTSPKDHLV